MLADLNSGPPFRSRARCSPWPSTPPSFCCSRSGRITPRVSHPSVCPAPQKGSRSSPTTVRAAANPRRRTLLFAAGERKPQRPKAARSPTHPRRPHRPRADAGTGNTTESGLGEGDIRIALLQHFPYPHPDLSALAHGTRGDVILDAVIDEHGKVTRADAAQRSRSIDRSGRDRHGKAVALHAGHQRRRARGQRTGISLPLRARLTVDSSLARDFFSQFNDLAISCRVHFPRNSPSKYRWWVRSKCRELQIRGRPLRLCDTCR